MKYYRRNIVLTKRPLKEAFIYKDVFILQPIVRKDIPSCPYAQHYPAFLDYWIDSEEGKTEYEWIQYDINKTQEICTILTALSNFEIFTYDSSLKAWGVVAPSKSFDEMSIDEKNRVNAIARNSIWLPIASYIYDGFNQDRIISCLQIIEGNTEMSLDGNPLYFTDNPVEENKEKVIFNDKIKDVLECYFALPDEIKNAVYSAMVLIANGIKLGIRHQSLGFISYISSIETMVGIEYREVKVHHCKTCGQPVFSVRKKFLAYLEKYVSKTEVSKKKFINLYTLRSRIAHSGKLFLSDIEFSLLNREEIDTEWFKYLEVQQLARLSLYRWLLLNNK